MHGEERHNKSDDDQYSRTSSDGGRNAPCRVWRVRLPKSLTRCTDRVYLGLRNIATCRFGDPAGVGVPSLYGCTIFQRVVLPSVALIEHSTRPKFVALGCVMLVPH
jgi:hypothetical protein